MPSDLPLTVTSARFFTSPKSIHTCAPLRNHSAGALMVLVLVPVPEKYFTPASELSLHDDSVSSVIDDGAPQSGGKLTFHGPSTVVSCFSTTAGTVWLVSLVGFRKTTNTVPHGSSCSGTVVRPSAMVKETGSVFPVSAYHNSGALPVTRNVACTCAPSSLRLSTKYTSALVILRCRNSSRLSLPV